MNILITGVGPHNKGAELMLLAILDQLRRRLPQANPVIHPGSGPYDWRARLGLFQLFDPMQSGRLGWAYKRLLHKGHRKQLGLMLPEEIDVVMDASGYAYGDAWRPEWVEGALKQFQKYKHLGARIVLLPQAFGPFENKRIRSASERILNIIDLAFVRDSDSLAYCEDIAPGHAGLHRAPDFTVLLEGVFPKYWIADDRHVALVPNRKMLTHSDQEVARNYLPVMAQVVRKLTDSNLLPFVLIHEQQDAELAREIAKLSGVECKVVREHDPLAIKGILSTCTFTIGSRFHGLVSALCTEVPSVATGWSHKYRCLFSEFGIDEWICPLHDKGNALLAAVDNMLNVDTRVNVSRIIGERAGYMKNQAQIMWDLVTEKIAE